MAYSDSLAPADCELGVLPELVENGMYLCRGLLYTCFQLGLLNLASIIPILSTLQIPGICHNFRPTPPNLPFSSMLIDFLLLYQNIPPLPTHISAVWEVRGKGGSPAT